MPEWLIGILVVFSFFLATGLFFGGVNYLDKTEEKRDAVRLQKKSQETGKTVSFLLMEEAHPSNFMIGRFAREDAEEIRASGYAPEAFEKFSESKNVFTENRVFELLSQVENKHDVVFRAEEVTSTEWGVIFGRYSKYLESNVEEQRKMTNSLNPEVLSKIHGMRNPVSPLQITADVDVEMPIEQLVERRDSRDEWDSQYNELIDSEDSSSR